MRKMTFHLCAALMALCLLSITVLAQPDSSQNTDADFPDGFDHAVVNVHFDDAHAAYKLAAGFEPMESRYDSGSLVFYVDRDLYPKLLDTALALGLRVEIDKQRTQSFAEREAQRAQLPPLGPEVRSIPGFSCYRTVEETFAAAQALVAARPDLASWNDIGDSWEKVQALGGYNIMVLKLTNAAIPGPKPKLILSSAIHAREYTTAELCTRFGEYLVDNHGVDPDATWILDYNEVHLILQLNPDGRKKAETGLSWRKNTNQNVCGATSNNRGVDLNRNLPFQWDCCGGSSSSECSSTYHGPGPASEPETQALVNYLIAEFPDQRGPGTNDPAPRNATGVYIDIHSSGQLVLWSWGFTSTPPPNPELQTLGRKFAYIDDHVPQQSIELYVTDGTTKDFAYGELGVAGFTFELGTQFFEQCGVFEDLVLAKNLPALIYAAKAARTPYITSSGPDSLNLSLSEGFSPATAIPAGALVSLNAIMDDGRYNNVNGTEPTQAVASAELYVDTPPWETSPAPVALPLNPADGAFNSSVERVTGTIDTTGLSEGRHTLFVRGLDANGDPGAVSALFLYVDNSASLPVTVFEDDFETDKGWTANPGGTDSATTGQWQRANPQATNSTGSNSTGPKQLDITADGDFALVTAAAAGSSVGTNDIDNGVTSIRSPNIALPVGAQALTLSFSYYLAHTTNSSSADFLRVTLFGTSSNQVILEELGAAADDDAEYARFHASLDAFAGQTVYLLIEAADNGNGSIVEAAIDDLRIIGVITGANSPPFVDAGPDQTVVITAGASLDGTVADDGLPNPPSAFTTQWSQVSGPGSVSFGDVNAVDTTADFTSTGVYVLRLEADDSELTNSDDLTLTVIEEPVSDIVFEDDFETDKGWTANPGGSDTATTGQWERGDPQSTSSSGPKQLGATVSGSFDLVTGAAAGSGAGSFDIDNGVTSIRSPDIALPAGQSLSLSFWYYFAHRTNASAVDFLRVSVVSGSGSLVVYEETGEGGDDDAVFQQFSTSLDAFAGQTVYLLIEAADNGNGSLVEAAIDDVLIRTETSEAMAGTGEK